MRDQDAKQIIKLLSGIDRKLDALVKNSQPQIAPEFSEELTPEERFWSRGLPKMTVRDEGEAGM